MKGCYYSIPFFYCDKVTHPAFTLSNKTRNVSINNSILAYLTIMNSTMHPSETKHIPLLDYLKAFINYCIKPVPREPDIKQPVYSLKNLFGGFAVLFLFYMGVMSLLGKLLKLEEMDHAMLSMIDEMPMWLLFIVAVIVAPIIEEAIFRFPIKFFKRQWFPIAFWLFALIFGFVHISNFGAFDSGDYWKAPLLVFPQLVLGFYLGFVRMQFSWPHSVAIHMLNNLIPMTMLIIATVLDIPIQ